MKKIKLRIICNLLILQIIFGIFSNVFASELKTSLDVIQQASETKYLENDQGYISKTIVNSNASTGEVTVELKLSNTKKDVTKKGGTEIMLVIDNSGSMDFTTADGTSRKSILLNSAKNLVNSVFNTSDNVKMGVIKFCGETNWLSPLYAATVITQLTSNKDDVINGLNKLASEEVQSATNIQKGLMKAEEQFSEDASNKVIILLTDGLPNEDGNDNAVKDAEMITTNENYKTIIANTKAELVKIKESGISLISLMTGVNSDDIDDSGNPVTTTEDDLKAIEMLFGTEGKPTAGKFYNAKTTDVNKVVENDITKDVQEILNSPINSVKITDYFPTDIIDNFEFSYVGKPSIGTASTGIDTKTNTIEWNIGTLKGDEVATLQYKLKIKDMKNQKLLNKTISTNEKVVLNYTDTDATDYTVTLSSSPKIQLSEVKDINIGGDIDINGNVEINGNINGGNGGSSKKDNTTATGNIPQTGMNYAAISAIALIAIISIVSYKKYTNYKDVK